MYSSFINERKIFKDVDTQDYNFSINLLTDQEPLFSNRITLDKKTDPNNIPNQFFIGKDQIK